LETLVFSKWQDTSGLHFSPEDIFMGLMSKAKWVLGGAEAPPNFWYFYVKMF